jgi:carbon-monoxide dehydrogenase small subunit
MTTKVETREITVTVNGRERTGTVEPRLTLADFLRDGLDLVSVHLGCEHGVCGCCTVLLDGRSIRSCLMLAVQAHGHEIETVESLSSDPANLHPIQEAFAEHHALQCGFCTPAMILRTKELVASGVELTPESARAGIAGILCRCTGYQNIVKAVLASAGNGGR